jgi:hypothetical protein
MLLAFALGLANTLAVAQQPPLRFPQSHPDFGLPNPEATWLPFHQDPEHVCNRIWRALYLKQCVPTVVGGALKAERSSPKEFFVAGWYFQKRPGLAEDQRWFGGDGRQMPVEEFDAEGSAQLAAWLQQVDGDILQELRTRPRAAVWFQHDLLRLARRLLDVKKNAELLTPLWHCVQRVALPRAVLQSAAVRTADFAEIAKQLPDFDPQRSIEIARHSSRLFDAEYVQLWSSVYLTMPTLEPKAAEAWLLAGRERSPLPLHSMALLIQGIVAIDDTGRAVATDLVIEARTQRFSNREPLAFDNPTTTRDGVDFAMWSLPREAVRDCGATTTSIQFAKFRAIDMESQELFRDYGSRKHTTYAAQCTLCHRRSNTPDVSIAGFSALRLSSQPHRAEPGERRTLAETQMQRFVTTLRAE